MILFQWRYWIMCINIACRIEPINCSNRSTIRRVWKGEVMMLLLLPVCTLHVDRKEYREHSKVTPGVHCYSVLAYMFHMFLKIVLCTSDDVIPLMTSFRFIISLLRITFEDWICWVYIWRDLKAAVQYYLSIYPLRNLLKRFVKNFHSSFACYS